MEYITNEKVTSWIPIRDPQTYKNKLGHVLCVGGNADMGGAIILSAMAALNAGAGLVTVASDPVNRSALHSSLPEIMFTDMHQRSALAKEIKGADVILLGPGLGRETQAEKIFHFVLNHVQEDQWLVLDADALYFYAELNLTEQLRTQKIVLTPHLGEWERISAIKAPADKIAINQTFMADLNSVLVLKKAATEVYFENEVWQNTAGNPSMATGGMGDTLAGIISGFLGQFKNKKQAILSAVYVHSAIADELAETHYVTLPSQISKELPIFMKKLTKDQGHSGKNVL